MKHLTMLPKGTTFWSQGLGRTCCQGCGLAVERMLLVWLHEWRGALCDSCYSPNTDTGYTPSWATYRLTFPEES